MSTRATSHPGSSGQPPGGDASGARVYRRGRARPPHHVTREHTVRPDAPPQPDLGFEGHTLRRPPEEEPTPEAPRRPWRWRLGVAAVLLALTVWVGGFVGPFVEAARDGVETRLAALGFTFTTLDVRGVVRVSPDDIERALALPAGSLIFDLDTVEARTRIETLPWVRHAAVMRLLPNRVVVIVQERRPLAVWRARDEAPARLVDDRGEILENGDPASHPGLPLVIGPGGPAASVELAAALRERPRLRRLARSFEWTGERRWDVHLRSGAVVKLPEGPAPVVLAQLARLDVEAGVLDAPLGVIDMRGWLSLRPPAQAIRASVRERGV